MNPKDPVCQNGSCSYRIAPEGLISIAINLASQPATATVQLPNGSTLFYEPIVYDGKHGYPSAPAGADTTVLAFRLASVINRNGYLACFTYAEHNDTRRGQMADLHSIVYGLTPSQASGCPEMLDPQHRPEISRHEIDFHYDDLASSGFFPSWTLRFGASFFQEFSDECKDHRGGYSAGYVLSRL